MIQREKMTRQEVRQYEAWRELCKRIADQTPVSVNESEEQKEARKQDYRNDFPRFCKYYFPHYMDSEFAWFHIKAAKKIKDNKDLFAILEWPREHAKSVFVNVMIPLYLYARGEITGMMLASANQDKAKVLLGDIQAEFESNNRFIYDYGNLVPIGDWRDGQFTTTDGIGFWAFGRGQSPRGTRKGSLRPNYGVIDDIDDKVIVRNLERVREAVDWILEDFYGALAIKGSRLIVAGNRIYKTSILAHLVGDVQPEDPKRDGIFHLKVYAIEDKKHQKSDFSNPDARPAWPRYTKEDLVRKMTKIGFRAARREFFHEHHEEGFTFKYEWIQWRKPGRYTDLVVYCDPSFKSGKDNDYKAVILLGKNEDGHLDILDAWIRQASVGSMVATFYDWFERWGNRARYYIEANFMQDLLMDDFTLEGENRGAFLPIRKDKDKKPDKVMRIENISPLFERGLIWFSEAKRQSPDMQTLVNQILGFPFGPDDGPDALEGAIQKLQKSSRKGRTQPRSGRYKTNNLRR